MPDSPSVLFDVSWEVCNKADGIHTVLSNKLVETKKRFGDRYILIGPLLENQPEFEEESGLELLSIHNKLQIAGVNAKIGRWKNAVAPRVILVKFQNSFDLSKLLYQLWEDFGVDSMSGGADYQEPVLFSTLAAKAIEALSGLYGDARMTAHFYGWNMGAGLLYLKKRLPQAASLFSTQVTVLGHRLAQDGQELYHKMDSLN